MPLTDAAGCPILFHPTVHWTINGVSTETNGVSLEITHPENASETTMLGGRKKRVVVPYKDSPRVTGPCTLNVTLPRVSPAFFQELRRFREFGEPFHLMVSLYDPDLPVMVHTDTDPGTGRPRFWAPHRWIADDATWKLYFMNLSLAHPFWVEQTNGGRWTTHAQDGYIEWLDTPPSQAFAVGMTYRWAPRVRILEIVANDAAGFASPLFKPQLTLREEA